MRPSLLALLAACAPSPEAPGHAPSPEPIDRPAPQALRLATPASPEQEAALKRAREAADALATALRTRLQAAMAEGGPSRAVQVCADEAQGIAAQVQGAHAVKVGRATDRPRNPRNAEPDWAVQWLAAQQQLPADQVAPTEGIRPDTQAAVVARPIRIEPVCVTCHGPEEQIAPEVRAILAERYPTDRGTGYATGDLRGVLWAEAPVGD